MTSLSTPSISSPPQLLIRLIISLSLFSGCVHVASYFNHLLIDEESILYFVLHVASLGSLLSLLWWHSKNNLDQVVLNQLYQKNIKILIPLSFYIAFSWLGSMGELGDYKIKDGRYVKTDRGQVVQTFKTQNQFELSQRDNALRSQLGFSGLWFLFSFGSFLMFRSSRQLQEKEKQLLTDPLSPQMIKQFVSEYQSVHVPEIEQFHFSQRMNLTQWKLLKIFVPLQSIILIAVGYYFEFYFFVFGGCFTSLALVNYFPFRKYVQFYLINLQFNIETQHCIFEYFQYNQLKKQSIPLSELRMVFREARMGRKRYSKGLDIYQNDHLYLTQNSIGFWEKKRLQALKEGFEALPNKESATIGQPVG